MSTDETLLQVVARQVEDIHYALGLGRDEDGAPVPPPAIWSGLIDHAAADGRKCAVLLPHQSADCISGQPGDGEALIPALGELILAVAVAPAEARTLLATCQFCRNRLLYLLDTAPYAGSAYHQFGRRLIALPQDHALFHSNPQARDHGDARTPQIRGISHGQ